MHYYVIGEPEYASSNWYRNILDGLIREKRHRRFPLTFLSDPSTLSSLHPETDDVIFIIGTNSRWLDSIVEKCEEQFLNRCIVLGNHNRRLVGRHYSIVTADISSDLRTLYSYLKSTGCNRIALYGINPDSTSDAFKTESFLSCDGSQGALFFNRGSLRDCYRHFSTELGAFDGVICVNDYCAISLLRHLPAGNKLSIVSCCSTPLSDFFSPHIPGIRIDYGAFGHAGIELSRLLARCPNISAVDIFLSSPFSTGQPCCGSNLHLENVTSPVQKGDDPFYSDPEVEEMLQIETLLCNCSESDQKILQQLMIGKTYTQIADALFISITGVKYKVKGFCRQSHTNSRQELVALLQKYL